MTTCQDKRNGRCCCRHCKQDRLIDPECCKCVPRFICYSFTDPNDEYFRDVEILFEHDSDGVYYPYNLGEVYLSIAVLKNDDGDCVWRLRNYYIDHDPGGEDYEVETQVYDKLVSTPGVGCMTGDDEQEGYTIIGWDHAGALPHASFIGDATISPQQKILIPVKEDDEGRLVKICKGCDCFPECLCIAFNTNYSEYDDPDNPGVPPILNPAGSILRNTRICWDDEKGEHGAWHGMFTDQTGSSCDGQYPYEILLELSPDAFGTCQFRLTTLVNGVPTIFDRDYSTNGMIDCNDIASNWIHDVDELTRISFIISESNCVDLCIEPCCEFMPEELTATITCDEIAGGSASFPLTRNNCAQTSYYGEFEVDWDCSAFGDGAGTGLMRVGVSCSGCKYSFEEEGCKCDCDDEANPAVTGCFTLYLFRGDDFVCYNPLDCNWGDIGSLVSNPASLCGYQSGIQHFSSCVPIFAMWRPHLVGVGMCLDQWTLEITE